MDAWWTQPAVRPSPSRRLLQAGVLGRHTLPGVVGMSVLAAGGHVATFVIAARSAGSSAPLAQLLPLALVVLLAMALPINVGGWGPREGVAAWVFGAAGLGVDRGVVVAVVYGVMVLVASLPGAVLLLVARLGHRDVGPASPDQPGRVARPSAGGDEAAHG